MWFDWMFGAMDKDANGLGALGFKADEQISIDDDRVNVVLARHLEPAQFRTIIPPCATAKTLSGSRPPNQSLMKVNKGIAEWLRGPLLVVGVRIANKQTIDASFDLVAEDFRHAVDNLGGQYCASSMHHMFADFGACQSGRKQITAVRVNCVGDQQLCKRSTYQSVTEQGHFLRLDEKSDIPTPIAQRIGLELVMRNIAPAMHFRTKVSKMESQEIGMLNPPHQADNTGSFILARKDGKPLLPVHVLALSMYTDQRLKKAEYELNIRPTRANMNMHLLGRLSKEDFKKW